MFTIDLLEPILYHHHFLLAEAILLIHKFAASDGLRVGIFESVTLNFSLGFSVDDLELAVSELAHEESLEGVILWPSKSSLLLVFAVVLWLSGS